MGAHPGFIPLSTFRLSSIQALELIDLYIFTQRTDLQPGYSGA